MVGSTALSTRLDAEEQRDVVSRLQHRCAREIERFAGNVAQFLGDGILAYFGYPTAHEDDAERAVRAALALLKALEELERPPDATLGARIGIATGVVVVGDLEREGMRQENAAIGETTNIAARLQALAEPDAWMCCSACSRCTTAAPNCKTHAPSPRRTCVWTGGPRHARGFRQPTGRLPVPDGGHSLRPRREQLGTASLRARHRTCARLAADHVDRAFEDCLRLIEGAIARRQGASSSAVSSSLQRSTQPSSSGGSGHAWTGSRLRISPPAAAGIAGRLSEVARPPSSRSS
jgi:class 3 adenylate cyclase